MKMRTAEMILVMNSVRRVLKLLRLYESKSAAVGLKEAFSADMMLMFFDNAVSL